MVITYHGEGTFRIQSGETSILVDPTSNRFKADVTLRTTTAPDADPAVGSEITIAGEYEVSGVDIRGVALTEESNAKILKTAYAVRLEDIHVVIFGPIEKMPTAEVLEHFDEPDIVIMPTGKNYISSQDAVHLIKQIEPGIVIPSYDGGAELSKALGQRVQSEEKLVIKKKDIVPGASRLVVLESAS